MPPLPEFTSTTQSTLVPVISTPSRADAVARQPPRRQYAEGPLPVRPNAHAPKNAHISGREQDQEGGIVHYKLKIGDVEVNDVGVDEILDYVSAWELEDFEMKRFSEDIEILKVLEANQESQRKAKLARAAEKARMRGAVLVAEDSDADDVSTEERVGKHGRARPDYSKFYKPRRGKGGIDIDDVVEEPMLDASAAPAAPVQLEPHIRRRRKRHPLTGQLMPLGWRYDPEAERNDYGEPRTGLGSSSLSRLSISDQPQAKRQRLDSSPSPELSKAEIMGRAASQSTPRAAAVRSKTVNLLSDDEVIKKSPAKQAGNSMLRGTMASTTASSAKESSTEPDIQQSSHPISKLMPPLPAAGAVAARPDDPTSNDGTSDDEVGEDEWFIESILGHHMSDPRTHPQQYGKQPVMLYNVKWEGFETPTWEPEDSFGDRSFVDAYRKKAGLEALPNTEGEGHEAEVVPLHATKAAPEASRPATESDEEDSEGEYDIEKIVAHHLSDPRTHPKMLGKTPVMLYQVKWLNFDELTWEPEDSFDDDTQKLIAYKRQHGLR